MLQSISSRAVVEEGWILVEEEAQGERTHHIRDASEQRDVGHWKSQEKRRDGVKTYRYHLQLDPTTFPRPREGRCCRTDATTTAS